MALLRLSRHFETESNKQKLFGDGPLDDIPSDLGKRQADCLAARFHQEPVLLHKIWTGTSVRSKKTARIAVRADASWKPHRALIGLNELMVGEWSGLSKEELPKEELLAWRNGELLPPGAETPEKFDERAMAAYDAITEAFDEGENLDVFTSGNPIRFILGQVFQTPWRNLLPTQSIDNCGLTTLLRKDEVWTVLSINDVSHLRDVGVSALPGT